MPKVSVVIPVYNVEKYLKQCLDSVINQTLRDIEIICVDDGSTDTCPQILDNYAYKDSRIKVIHKTNSGYGHSMNVGIDAAIGEYIGIVESDDWILPNMYEMLYIKAKKYNLDFIKSDYYMYWGKYDYKRLYHYGNLEQYYNQLLIKDDMEIFWKYNTFNWTGIYKREFLISNDIRHNETAGASYQDTSYRVEFCSVAERAMFIDNAFYMYRQDNPMSSVKSKQKMMALFDEYKFIFDYLQKHNGQRYIDLCKAHFMATHIWTFNRIDNSLKREYAKIVYDDYMSKKDSIKWDKLENAEYIINWLEMLCKNPDEFCEKTIAYNYNLQKKLKQKIIIYGTGKVSKNVFHRLLELNYDDNILFFVETSPKDNKFLTFDIKKAEEIVKYKDNALVIISVGKSTGAYDEVIANLERLGITNYLDYQYLWQQI